VSHFVCAPAKLPHSSAPESWVPCSLGRSAEFPRDLVGRSAATSSSLGRSAEFPRDLVDRSAATSSNLPDSAPSRPVAKSVTPLRRRALCQAEPRSPAPTLQGPGSRDEQSAASLSRRMEPSRPGVDGSMRRESDRRWWIPGGGSEGERLRAAPFKPRSRPPYRPVRRPKAVNARIGATPSQPHRSSRAHTSGAAARYHAIPPSLVAPIGS
jgi:hypothetical protein